MPNDLLSCVHLICEQLFWERSKKHFFRNSVKWLVQDHVGVCCAHFGTMDEFCGEGECDAYILWASNF